MRIIKVGSRDSKLAVIQAQMVIDAIKAYDSSIKTQLITMKTTGDKILDKTLDKIGGKGLFVKELDDALLNNQVDITVHSYKDMPMELAEELPVVAVSKREDVRDVFIVGNAKDAPVGCSSKRRTIQLNALGHKNIIPLRGNVITRLNKLDSGQYSAIILAAAGIIRLGLTERISNFFTTEEIMPAACQGIIAVQSRKGENIDYLSLFNDKTSEVTSCAERAFVTRLNGGCSSPVAAYAQLVNDEIILQGLYVDEEKNIVRRGEMRGKDPQNLGVTLAQKLMEGESI